MLRPNIDASVIICSYEQPTTVRLILECLLNQTSEARIEIIVCDLESDKIVFIEGNLSGKKVGDTPFLCGEEFQVGEVINSQLSHGGKIIRSINVLIGGSD